MLTFLKPTLNIQISPERVTVKNVKSGVSISEVPEMAISSGNKPTIMAVGGQARLAAAAQAAKLINPFAHPRSLVSDFTYAQLLLKYLVRHLLGSSILALAPKVVVHPLGAPAGGFTQVEIRAFLEMGHGVGASKVFVWTGRVLNDAEVASHAFPLTEGHLSE